MFSWTYTVQTLFACRLFKTNTWTTSRGLDGVVSFDHGRWEHLKNMTLNQYECSPFSSPHRMFASSLANMKVPFYRFGDCPRSF
jgi:hypothetical protein